MNNISPTELLALLKNKAPLQLIDVREADERAEFNIGGTWIPLALLNAKLNNLNQAEKTVVYCRSGGRSANACNQLINAGFNDVSNLEGGMLAWQALSLSL